MDTLHITISLEDTEKFVDTRGVPAFADLFNGMFYQFFSRYKFMESVVP